MITVPHRGGGEIGYVRATARLCDPQGNPLLSLEDGRSHLRLHPLGSPIEHRRQTDTMHHERGTDTADTDP